MNLTQIICIVLAAFFNAVMDLVENENFSSSVFKNLNPNWWYKRESWKHAHRLLGWKFDSWHVAKSLMLFCIMAAVATDFKNWVFYGIFWNLAFSLWYKLLKN